MRRIKDLKHHHSQNILHQVFHRNDLLSTRTQWMSSCSKEMSGKNDSLQDLRQDRDK